MKNGYLRKSLFQATLQNLFKSLKKCRSIRMKIKTFDDLGLCGLSATASCCCEIPESKDAWSVKHGLLV